MAAPLGGRLAHVHLGDGTKPGLPDEHLVPGRGTQPCAELLGWLRATGYAGAVVLEVSTRRAASPADRQADLAESLDFARPTWTAPRWARGRATAPWPRAPPASRSPPGQGLFRLSLGLG